MNPKARKNENLKGWLKRKGGRMNTWSRRWFVLNDKFLFMYLREEDSKSADCITLDEHSVIEHPIDINDPKKVVFDIVTDSEKAPSETVLSLCAESEEEKKIWIRALNRALFADKGGALFSQSLEEILFYEKQENRRIPYIITECIDYLYNHALEVEGIFRLPGRQSVIKDIISRFEKGHKVSFEQEGTDVHAVASVLKAFLRDLPDSIIPCSQFQKFMNFALRFQGASSDEERDAVVEELASNMHLIPPDNYVILKHICLFLHDVGKHESINKMSMMNLGTVFGYNIIRHIDKENSQLFLCTADLSQNLVYMLINYFSQVFALEYNDSGAVAHNVPTADLLRMSKVIDVPPVLPFQAPGHIADLEGIDLLVRSTAKERSSPLPKRDSGNSEVRMRNTLSLTSSDSNNDEDNAFLNSAEVREELSKRPSLLRVVSQPAGSSRSLPSSPVGDAPIPPERSKSKKITRHRMVSDRRRPGGIVVVSGDGVQQRPISPRDRNLNSDDVIAALTKASIYQTSKENDTEGNRGDNAHTNHITEARPMNVQSNNTGEPGEPETAKSPALKPVPSVRRKRPEIGTPSSSENRVKLLQQQVEHLTEEIAQQKKHHRSQVNALQAQLTDMKQKYERRIETMEAQFGSQKERLEAKLKAEEEGCADAVAYTIKLKEELHRYQMQYGELPT
ncbi:rho GTPase-activating protein 24 [Plakobranchus ocellatus]|uniref:Rho GTPase-activating protein 24 n=1 Tax=Plakobranchus ocellatus TaxID=259542 RepID=A0AAV4D269_9GAST|nr:rho GTPase-activating protein 24 [Plakobranchus ocellatus]